MATHEYDLVIRNGIVIDGTGADRRVADVAVNDGVIAAVDSEIAGTGRREIDATGLLVTPGFVDIHTHYDGQATWDTQMTPSSWHGVTTVVFGNCGVGFAPVHDRDHERLIQLMEGVEDIPGTVLHEGLDWQWNGFRGFLDALDAQPRDLDVAAQVPHAALRLHVMGERGAKGEMATPDDIVAMAELAKDGVAAGALGFTTSRTILHKSSTGDPTPSLRAAKDELVGIATAVGELDAGVLQVVSDFFDADSEMAIFRSMVEESGRPLSLSLLQSPFAPDAWRRVLDLLTEANADGIPMAAQVAAHGVGFMQGLNCTLHPFMVNPVWQEVAHLPVPEQAAAMRDPEFKARVLAAHTDDIDDTKLGGAIILFFKMMFPMENPPNYEPDPATSVAAVAESLGREPAEYAYDLLAEGDGSTMLYMPAANYLDGNLDVVGEMIGHAHTVPGLSDGGAHVGMICDGSFPTTLLTLWGRDRDHGRHPLEFLVQRQCQGTATTVGLADRGVLAPGYRADINIIDFEALDNRPPEVLHDLPAGGRRLVQRADGYRHTFVAGVETYVDGQHTGALPGVLIRGAQPAPASDPVSAAPNRT